MARKPYRNHGQANTIVEITKLWKEANEKVKKMKSLAGIAYAYVNNPQEIEVWLDEIIRVADEGCPTQRAPDRLRRVR